MKNSNKSTVRKSDNPEWRKWRATQGGSRGGLRGGATATSIEYKCPHCEKIGHGPSMKRWHYENCPSLVKQTQ